MLLQNEGMHEGWTPVPPPIADLERQHGQELGPG